MPRGKVLAASAASASAPSPLADHACHPRTTVRSSSDETCHFLSSSAAASGAPRRPPAVARPRAGTRVARHPPSPRSSCRTHNSFPRMSQSPGSTPWSHRVTSRWPSSLQTPAMSPGGISQLQDMAPTPLPPGSCNRPRRRSTPQGTRLCTGRRANRSSSTPADTSTRALQRSALPLPRSPPARPADRRPPGTAPMPPRNTLQQLHKMGSHGQRCGNRTPGQRIRPRQPRPPRTAQWRATPRCRGTRGIPRR
mmetsp:Transcript_38139/g.93329  ORF Transcript_38139/g.93329 Transcript_38139/m.93329 type:complete len:252 (-) Transcript_38139:165-920(-)